MPADSVKTTIKKGKKRQRRKRTNDGRYLRNYGLLLYLLPRPWTPVREREGRSPECLADSIVRGIPDCCEAKTNWKMIKTDKRRPSSLRAGRRFKGRKVNARRAESLVKAAVLSFIIYRKLRPDHLLSGSIILSLHSSPVGTDIRATLTSPPAGLFFY